MSTTSTNAQVLEAEWRKKFLTEYESSLVFKKLGMMGDVPPHSGMVVSWFQMDNFATGAVIAQTSDPAATTITTTLQSATLQQVSQNIELSDVLIRQATEEFMPNTMKRLGRAAAETEDTLIRNSIFTAGGMVQYGGTAAFRNSIADNASFDLDITEVRRAVRKLESANAIAHPLAQGDAKYCGVIGPDGKFDLIGDDKWVDIAVNTSDNVGRVASNSIGTIYGVTWYPSTQAFTVSNSGSANTDVIQTYVVGGEHFGIAEAVGTEIVTNIPSPLSKAGLYGTVAYKYLTAYKELHASGMVRIETSTSTETRAT